MSQRFIALHPGDETDGLIRNHPNAFLLLAQIALRAKWKDDPVSGLKAGQAFIGDWQGAGLRSRKEYRHAQKILTNCGFGAFKGANKGTIATLMNPRIFSITAEPGAIKRATEGPSRGHQGATNHLDTQSTQTLFAMDGTNPDPSPPIAWTAENGFTGISDQDRDEWRAAFPSVNIDVEIAKASRWLKDNPTKRKKQLGRFISGWLSRTQERGGSTTVNSQPAPQPGTARVNGRIYKTI